MRASLAPPGRARGKPAVAHRSSARAPSKQSSKMAHLSTPSRWKLVEVTAAMRQHCMKSAVHQCQQEMSAGAARSGGAALRHWGLRHCIGCSLSDRRAEHLSRQCKPFKGLETIQEQEHCEDRRHKRHQRSSRTMLWSLRLLRSLLGVCGGAVCLLKLPWSYLVHIRPHGCYQSQQNP
jgi:hypothetical protein